ncbi:MAG: hypothetical protein AB7S81_05850 [Bdellovibrionales bacterium]
MTIAELPELERERIEEEIRQLIEQKVTGETQRTGTVINLTA